MTATQSQCSTVISIATIVFIADFLCLRFHLTAYIVYIDWILGTPCLLYNLATLIHCPTSNIIQLVTYDILMVGCGFIGTIVLAQPACDFPCSSHYVFVCGSFLLQPPCPAIRRAGATAGL
jgi:hypothetical protein